MEGFSSTLEYSCPTYSYPYGWCNAVYNTATIPRGYTNSSYVTGSEIAPLYDNNIATPYLLSTTIDAHYGYDHVTRSMIEQYKREEAATTIQQAWRRYKQRSQ